MNKTLLTIIGILAITGVVLGAVAYNRANQPVNVGVAQKGEKGDKGDRGPQGERGPAGKDGRNGGTVLGAAATPDFMTDYISVGGQRLKAYNRPFVTSTTTVCAQQAIATSTLVLGAARFSVGSTTATTLTWAKASTQYATTTNIATSSLAANAQTTFLAATTSAYVSPTGARIAQAQSDITFAPSEWLVLSMTGGTGHFSPTGSCAVVFAEI